MKLIKVFKHPFLDGLIYFVAVLVCAIIIGYASGAIYALVEHMFF